MKEFKHIVHIVIFIFVWHCFIFSHSITYAEESLEDTIDCTDVNVDYLEDSSLTREERLRLMDKALFKSLNKFELCQDVNKMEAAAAAAAVASGVGGGGDFEETDEEIGDRSGVESVASSAMSGTEHPQGNPPAEGTGEKDSGALQDPQDMAESGSKTGGNTKRSTGKLPEDIPSAQNDDTLAAQIRYAAENETDPVKSKQLWNEYRKYKGLATK